ncbi:hypothetical protein [Ruminococcus flavefaciens]|uniref:hypothetical protein n=1 Tax=Ruminococcus flavefaciens TaxID=1265 RepID=UPI0026EC159B|nr:hypothetical protein [Ruminococcus flavefaciens]
MWITQALVTADVKDVHRCTPPMYEMIGMYKIQWQCKKIFYVRSERLTGTEAKADRTVAGRLR